MTAKSRKIISILLLTFMLPCFILPTSATAPSEPTQLHGAASFGILFEEESPIVIEKHTVTYNIPELPTYDEDNNVSNCEGNVVTEYLLYNPTQVEVTITAILPMSTTPYYLSPTEQQEDSLYTVTINGERLNDEILSLKNIENYHEVYSEENFYNGYIYEITLSPGERVKTAVTAPIYPSIETAYEPATYFYIYSFPYVNADMYTGDVEVKLNTPYCIIPNEYHNFEKIDGGYSYDFLAKEDFSDGTGYISGGFFFTMCEVENPEKSDPPEALLYLIVALLIIFFPIVIAIALVSLISWGAEMLFSPLTNSLN